MAEEILPSGHLTKNMAAKEKAYQAPKK